MRTRFQQQMEDLREKLLRMGGLAELAMDRACQAYTERDLTRCQLVLENESLINAAEREIDEMAFDVLATQQPAASICASFSPSPRSTPTSSALAIRPSTSPNASWT
jgi:phosphate uptake regulator